MPTGRTIGQAVLDDNANGGGDNAAGVVAAGRGQVEHVGVEVVVAVRASVLGAGDVQVTRPPGGRITQIVKGAGVGAKAIGTVAALGAASARVVAGSLDDLGLGQVFDASDTFGGVGGVNSRCGHGGLRA